MKHVTLAACLLVFVLGELPYPARAAEPTTLTVSGQGSVSKAPDSALIDVAIVTSDDASAAKATAQNNTAYDRLRERLRGLGVRDDAIRTTSFARPRRENRSGARRPRSRRDATGTSRLAISPSPHLVSMPPARSSMRPWRSG